MGPTHDQSVLCTLLSNREVSSLPNQSVTCHLLASSVRGLLCLSNPRKKRQSKRVINNFTRGPSTIIIVQWQCGDQNFSQHYFDSEYLRVTVTTPWAMMSLLRADAAGESPSSLSGVCFLAGFSASGGSSAFCFYKHNRDNTSRKLCTSVSATRWHGELLAIHTQMQEKKLGNYRTPVSEVFQEVPINAL